MNQGHLLPSPTPSHWVEINKNDGSKRHHRWRAHSRLTCISSPNHSNSPVSAGTVTVQILPMRKPSHRVVLSERSTVQKWVFGT